MRTGFPQFYDLKILFVIFYGLSYHNFVDMNKFSCDHLYIENVIMLIVKCQVFLL